MDSSEVRTAAIIGFGYMGASMALDLLEQGVRVTAHDFPDALRGLKEVKRFQDIEIATSPADAATADLVVLAAPIQTNLRILNEIAPALLNTRLVIDVGSTKRAIVAAAESLGIGARFVGCHPLCGSALSGWNHARPGLFRDRRVYLCRTAESSESAVGLATTVWQSVGATVEAMNADEHDRLLAWTSHLPQALSTLLGVTLGTRGIKRTDLGPGGEKMTELAQSSPEVWSPILLDNMDNVGEALDAFAEQLQDLSTELRKKNEQEISRVFRETSKWASSAPAGSGRK
ncbi:MAG: prephenate dehydrogenase [Gemmatimonadaceae bacterium]